MTINTDNYRSTHGRNPKPSQYGTWSFAIGRAGAYTPFMTTTTYREAIREARAEARMIGGASEIIVND